MRVAAAMLISVSFVGSEAKHVPVVWLHRNRAL